MARAKKVVSKASEEVVEENVFSTANGVDPIDEGKATPVEELEKFTDIEVNDDGSFGSEDYDYLEAPAPTMKTLPKEDINTGEGERYLMQMGGRSQWKKLALSRDLFTHDMMTMHAFEVPNRGVLIKTMERTNVGKEMSMSVSTVWVPNLKLSKEVNEFGVYELL